MTDPVVASAYRLDGVVTVIDAVAGETNLSTRPEAVRQIAVADRIVLTKSDLADPASLLKRIDALNPGAPVIVARHGAIDLATILNAGLFDPASKTPDVAGWLQAEAHAHHHHDHDESVTSFCLTFDRPLHWQGMGLWLEMLIQTRGKDLLRIKGILNLHGQDRPVVIQAVQHVLHPPVLLGAWPEGDPRTSRIVFITQDLPRAMIEQGMRAFEAAAI
jgi:G3E family GTPase